ncbi:MAG: sigma-54 dependent transcriptional regulator [Ignavibacteriales bacterium]|nr:sigma-54 dependent transcriptional regulator [Ignavibacteriales bacterium]
MNYRILIVDDDDLFSVALKRILEKMNYDVQICLDASRTFNIVESFEPDLILLDIYLTTHDGIEILKELQKAHSQIPVIMITGYSDVKIAVKAMKLGAYDFLLKPIDLDQLNSALAKIISHIDLKNEVMMFRTILSSEQEIKKEFFGKSRSISKVIHSVEKLAASDNTTILLEGESGTGKEVFAQFIHQKSPRNSRVFIPVNCATITKELAESELFGHERGAFTGAAQKTKLGKFELANGGTILLDEIGELNLDLQVKLLRVLQEKKFYRLGGEKEISVDVRILAATNRNLEEEVQKGNFREDLFYRLNVARIIIPPLRERREDIPILVYSFMNEFSQKFSKKITGIEGGALEFLQNQYWKGNVRELRNAMERAILMMDDGELKLVQFNFLTEEGKGKGRDEDKFVLKIPRQGVSIDSVIKFLILQTLDITKGNQVRAAKVLGLSRSKLRYRMTQLGIEVTKKVS